VTRLLPARAVRRIRLLNTNIETAGDFWLTLRMLCWRLLLPVLKWMLPLPRLVEIVSTSSESTTCGPQRAKQIVVLTRALYGPQGAAWVDNCLERSLVAYRFLCLQGAEPELVVGVSKVGGQVTGHVWVTLDGEPQAEDLEALESFFPVVAFDRSGRLEERRPDAVRSL
jgi:hypothetical protein